MDPNDSNINISSVNIEIGGSSVNRERSRERRGSSSFGMNPYDQPTSKGKLLSHSVSKQLRISDEEDETSH